MMPRRQSVMTGVLCPAGVPGAEVEDLTSGQGMTEKPSYAAMIEPLSRGNVNEILRTGSCFTHSAQGSVPITGVPTAPSLPGSLLQSPAEYPHPGPCQTLRGLGSQVGTACGCPAPHA